MGYLHPSPEYPGRRRAKRPDTSPPRRLGMASIFCHNQLISQKKITRITSLVRKGMELHDAAERRMGQNVPHWHFAP